MTTEELMEELAKYPSTAEVKTDVGASMFSGWGDIKEVVWHPLQNVVELITD